MSFEGQQVYTAAQGIRGMDADMSGYGERDDGSSLSKNLAELLFMKFIKQT